MIQIYIKIAWRNLVKYRFYTIANLISLITAITFTLLIGSYVWSELNVNKNLKNIDSQYILLSEWKEQNMGLTFTSVGALAKGLKEEYPQLVTNYYRFDGISTTVYKNDKKFRETIQIGDDSLLNMYGFKLLFGDANTALSKPNSVVITSNIALKYFGVKNVVGQTISIANFNNKRQLFNITGVVDELPKNSVTNINNDNNPEFFVPTDSSIFFDRGTLDSWKNVYVPSFVELQEGVSIKDLEKPIQDLITKHCSEKIKENITVKPTLLSDFYFNKDNATVKKMLFTLTIIGVFILLMAVINFVNITISMSNSRIKEIGVRKVLGGERKQLIFQFLVETFILVLISTLLSLIAFVLFRPTFSQLIGVKIPDLQSYPFYSILILLLFTSFVSLLAGSYPAIILSSFKPIKSLKGISTIRKTSFQKVLFGFQYSMALLILISAFIITKQVDYFFKKDLGYNKDFIITSKLPRYWNKKGIQKIKRIRDEFINIPQVTDASVSFEIPDGKNGMNFFVGNSEVAESEYLPIKCLSVDSHFFNTYKMSVLENRYTSKTDNKFLISINKSASEILGWKTPSDAIGKTIKIQNKKNEYIIQNVISDFHFDSMKHKIEPLIIFNLNSFSAYRYISFKVTPNNIQNTITSIRNKWNKLMPDNAFNYSFIDDSLLKLYESEVKLRTTIHYASSLSLIIVLLGIIALVSLNAHQRIKEIGIRKTIGASLFNIITLFVKEFNLIVFIASVITVPITFYLVNKWLDNYIYKINISPLPFLVSITLLTTFVYLLIGLLLFKITLKNPIKNLRTE